MSYHIYVRCSTDEQAVSGLGIEVQLQGCRQYVAKHAPDADVYEYIDRGVSGRKVAACKRPELMRAVNNCKKGDTILVLKRDRLGRDVIDNATIDHLVEKKKGRIISLECDETAMDLHLARLYRTIRDAFSQYEGALISQRVSYALQIKKGRGEVVGRTPYGYRVKKRGELKVLEPDPAEQTVITVMQKKREEGYTYQELTEWMDENDIRNRQGKKWLKHRIWHTLRRAAPVLPIPDVDGEEVEDDDERCLREFQLVGRMNTV